MPKKRSVEARRRRNQKKREKARSRKDSSEWSHLVRGESYQYECFALNCKMVVFEVSIPSERTRLASVGIVDINGVPVYEVYVPPPESCRLNTKSRKYYSAVCYHQGL